MLNFTDLSIQKLTPGYHWDLKVTGFGIRVGKNRKTWLIVKGKNRTKVTIGHYPDLSLADARKKALVALGTPLALKADISFTEAKEAYLGQNKWRPRSKKVLESSLRHFTWNRPLDRITHEDVAAALDAIKSPSARAHALKDIRSLFNWCVPRYLASSPAAGLKMAPQPKRARVLTDDEIRRVWIAAEDAGTFGTIVRLLLLTGQRKSEIGGLQWEWINQGGITLPSEVTKNGREHSFPMGRMAATCISTLTASPILPTTPSSLQSTGILFRSSGKKSSKLLPYNGYAFHLKQLQKASETSDWVLHDIRRSYATNMARLGVPIHVVEKLLNHISGSISGVAAVYNRYSYWEEQVEAVHKYENWLMSVVK